MKSSLPILVLALACTHALEAAPLPALRVSDNHRFLVTAEGRPFFWLADSYPSARRNANATWPPAHLGPWITTPTGGRITITASGGAANFSGIEIWNVVRH